MLDLDIEDHVFGVESGCLFVELMAASDCRTLVQILYPGDMVERRGLPPFSPLSLTAAAPSTVIRYASCKPEPVGSMPVHDPLGLQASRLRLLARAHLHAVVIGRLSSEQRLATMLLELAYALGHEAAGGVSFPMPLSRADIADYLALNPDTLSRLLSRLRTRKLVAMPTRSRAIVKSIDALAALSPLADAVREVYGHTAKQGRVG